jgi:TRAP-type C4-dicarboxylate transport system substrate-binding protein
MTRPMGIATMLVVLTGTAKADPQVLRMAAIAPEGTSWARELRAFAREIETGSKGELRMKWYLGGIAGDEMAALERVRKKQLDGVAGAIFCQSLAPSLRVANVPGLFRSGEEALYAIGRLRSVLDEEFRKSGFADLGVGAFGFDIIFSRKPVRSLDDLKKSRTWVWNLNPVWKVIHQELGDAFVESSVESAMETINQQKLDVLIAFPTAALAYQWSTQMQYFTPLNLSFMPACMVVSNATFDALSIERQQMLRTAAAKFFSRFNDVGRAMDEQLTATLFERQGLRKVPVSEAFRAEFHTAAAKARNKLGDLATRELIGKILAWIDEFHAQKRSGRESH